MMCIGHIKTTWIRRVVLIGTAPVLVPLALAGILIEEAWRAIQEIASAMNECWIKK
jgi:hypothetical protein